MSPSNRLTKTNHMKKFLPILLMAITMFFVTTPAPANDVGSQKEFRQQIQKFNFIHDQKTETVIVLQEQTRLTTVFEKSNDNPITGFGFEATTVSFTRLISDPLIVRSNHDFIILNSGKTNTGPLLRITPKYFYGNSRISLG